MQSDQLGQAEALTENACDYFSLALPCVQGLHPYTPGKPIEELQRELGLSNIIKLASNENPLGLSQKAIDGIQVAIKEGARYPDGNGFSLKSALKGYYQRQGFDLDVSQITLGNGSNDILELVARAYAGSNNEIIFSEYAFAVYSIVTKAVGAIAVEVPAKDWGHDLNAIASAITDKTKLIYLANPNNPTGTAFTEAELTAFLAKVPPTVIVVLDEAYGEYIDDTSFPNGLTFLPQYSNLIVSRTFSKAWGLASLRVGYSISNKAIADILNRVRQPFNVNTFALVSATAVLSDLDYLQKGVEINQRGLARIEQGLADMDISYIPSKGNFIAFDVIPRNGTVKSSYSGMDVYQLLLQEGVIVRPLANYNMANYLRVSIGLPEENERFLQALKKVLEQLRCG